MYINIYFTYLHIIKTLVSLIYRDLWKKDHCYLAVGKEKPLMKDRVFIFYREEDLKIRKISIMRRNESRTGHHILDTWSTTKNCSMELI